MRIDSTPSSRAISRAAFIPSEPQVRTTIREPDVTDIFSRSRGKCPLGIVAPGALRSAGRELTSDEVSTNVSFRFGAPDRMRGAKPDRAIPSAYAA